MRRLLLDDIQPGMVLARAVRNARGNVLIQPGVTLSERYIHVLRQLSFQSVLIHDPDTEDIEIADALSEHVRQKVTTGICRLHEAVVAGTASSDFDPEDLRQTLSDIVDDVLAAPAAVAMATMRSHDTYEFDHAIDGTVVALLIGRQLHLDLGDLRRLAAGCLLRDIGMLTIPTEILRKPQALTPDEWIAIRSHPEAGYRILRGLRPNEVIGNHVAYQHHERPDGLGYPRGLRDDNTVRKSVGTDTILPEAAIAAVADVYDALSTDRPYRPAHAPDRVIGELRGMAGTQLNREALGALLAILPVYPVGTEVLVRDGPSAGCRAIVVSVSLDRLDQPVIRLLFNPRGQRMEPREVDLGVNPMTITSILPGQPVSST